MNWTLCFDSFPSFLPSDLFKKDKVLTLRRKFLVDGMEK
ncbi:Putative protein [Zobellia galactanivorans]|uniref:Uncharacterized protein n=1 Tax=Zobellia galactanivorans (strain DSM 12802 / CCUG 47099 / CIP 106680 / NCIMB 13871 / Dsij) TaxID=63186 RepID=G0LCC2_ZOBGA|nr:Putative protein [Zobellia galactanivorans]